MKGNNLVVYNFKGRKAGVVSFERRSSGKKSDHRFLKSPPIKI